MLVISRKLGEGIVIDGNIHIKVVKIGKGRIRLGLTAPPSVRIHRSEEVSPVLEKPDGIESLGGASFANTLTLHSNPLIQSQDVLCARKAVVGNLNFPGFRGSGHGAGYSDCGGE
jgi:carbon storage regulator CsrA